MRFRTVLRLIPLLLLLVPTLARPADWSAPVYANRWKADTYSGLGTDGQNRIIALGQPPEQFDADGNSLGDYGSALGSEPRLWATIALSPAPNTHVYALNINEAYQRRIVELTRHGSLVRAFSLPGSLEPDASGDCRGIAVDPGGRIYMSSINRSVILVASAAGDSIDTWGSPGSGPDQLLNPFRIQFDSQGTLFIADHGNRRIQRITADGHFLPPAPIVDSKIVDFGFDSAGNIYALDLDLGVRVFDPAFHELGHWNDIGPGEELSDQRYLVLDAQDNVFVTWDKQFTGESYIARYDPHLLNAPPDAFPPKLVLDALPASGIADPCALGRLTDLTKARTAGAVALSDGSGPWYYAFLIVARGGGSFLAGIQCGITYQQGNPAGLKDGHGVDVFAWHLCGDLEFPTPAGLPEGAPDWPAPGSGTIITWDPANNCQRLDRAVAGYFYVGAYSPDTLRVITRPVDASAKVAYCATSGEHVLTDADLGFVTFSPGAASAGCNPVIETCARTVPVRPTTWSAIKAMIH